MTATDSTLFNVDINNYNGPLGCVARFSEGSKS